MRKMRAPSVFNPDDYLRTPAGRVYTDERNAAAWEQIYLDLEAAFAAFAAATSATRFVVVVGVQGAGKTTWIRSNHETLGPVPSSSTRRCPRNGIGRGRSRWRSASASARSGS